MDIILLPIWSLLYGIGCPTEALNPFVCLQDVILTWLGGNLTRLHKHPHVGDRLDTPAGTGIHGRGVGCGWVGGGGTETM